MLYLGTMVAGLYWLNKANKTKNTSLIHFTIKGIKTADRYFTLPSVILLVTFGLWASIQGNIPIMGSGWIAWSITVLLISGLVFSMGMIPLQKKMIAFTKTADSFNETQWTAYFKMAKVWNILAVITFLTALSAVFMMILKIPK